MNFVTSCSLLRSSQSKRDGHSVRSSRDTDPWSPNSARIGYYAPKKLIASKVFTRLRSNLFHITDVRKMLRENTPTPDCVFLTRDSGLYSNARSQYSDPKSKPLAS